MRDGYVGDIGDFAKYSLLHALVGGSLKLAVVWYLNPQPPCSGEGQFTEYPKLRECNPRLFDTLVEVRRAGRTLASIEHQDVLPAGTAFFRQPVPPGGPPHPGARREWHNAALRAVDSADLVFLDPDKGLRERAQGSKGTEVYVFYDEVQDYVQRNQSVVVYQHFQRDRDWPRPGLEALRLRTGVNWAWTLVFRRRGCRAFFVLPTADHRDPLADRSCRFLDSLWGKKQHFYSCGLGSPDARGGQSSRNRSATSTTHLRLPTSGDSIRPVTLQLDPDLVPLLEGCGRSAQESAREMIVLELYRRGTISSGRAAQALGVPRQSFIDLASRLGIPYFRLTEAELDQEARSSESL